MFVLLVIPLAAILVVNYFVAQKFEAIALQKGYDSSIHSFAMCFWLGIVGYIYVLALPNCSNTEAKKEVGNSNISGQSDNNSSKPLESVTLEASKYDSLVKKAEKFKDPFFDRDYRIRIYESLVKEMQPFANSAFEDSVQKLEEYKLYLEKLKTRQIK